MSPHVMVVDDERAMVRRPAGRVVGARYEWAGRMRLVRALGGGWSADAPVTAQR